MFFLRQFVCYSSFPRFRVQEKPQNRIDYSGIPECIKHFLIRTLRIPLLQLTNTRQLVKPEPLSWRLIPERRRNSPSPWKPIHKTPAFCSVTKSPGCRPPLCSARLPRCFCFDKCLKIRPDIAKSFARPSEKGITAFPDFLGSPWQAMSHGKRLFIAAEIRLAYVTSRKMTVSF